MKINLRKKLIRILAAALLVSLLFPAFSTPSRAGNLTALSDTMSRLAVTTASNHLISFTMTAGTEVIQDETITVTFPADFDTSTIDCGDVDLTDDTVDEDIQEEAGGCTASATEWGAAFAADVLTLTAPSGAATYINGSSVVTIEIGTNATADEAGNEQITNPGSDGSNTISIGGTFGDTGSLAVPIMSADQVSVSATVDPTITATLSDTTCALGTLTTASVSGCTYTNTIVTNATSGYGSTLVEDGNLCSPSVAVCTNSIGDSAGGAVNAGSEEYGFASSDTTGTPDAGDYDGACGGGASEAAEPIDGTETYANASAPTAGDVVTLCHAASITGATPAGSYSHTVTLITTGNF
ncbi:MAG: hypothetical protein Q8P13_01240 [bacterium]|nr:hypothetical protein [bacterium]